MWRCNDELRVHADEVHRSSNRDEVAKHYIGVYHFKLGGCVIYFILYEAINKGSHHNGTNCCLFST